MAYSGISGNDFTLMKWRQIKQYRRMEPGVWNGLFSSCIYICLYKSLGRKYL